MNVLKKYLGHIAGYVLSGAVVVSGLNPALFPPKYAFLTALATLVVTAAHHGFTAGNAGGVITAAAQAATDAISKAAAPLLLVGFLGLSALGLGGCATVQKIDATVTSPAAQPFIVAGAQVAVATAEQHGVTAAQIISIAQQALAADEGTASTLAGVAKVVNAQVAKLNLPAGDLAAISILEASFDAYIQAKIGNDATVAQTQAAVADVLTAIINAATVGVPAPAAPAPAPGQKSAFLESLESPTVVGAAASTLVVAGLKAFAHVSVAGPVAAAGVVMWTLLAGYLRL